MASVEPDGKVNDTGCDPPPLHPARTTTRIRHRLNAGDLITISLALRLVERHSKGSMAKEKRCVCKRVGQRLLPRNVPHPLKRHFRYNPVTLFLGLSRSPPRGSRNPCSYRTDVCSDLFRIHPKARQLRFVRSCERPRLRDNTIYGKLNVCSARFLGCVCRSFEGSGLARKNARGRFELLPASEKTGNRKNW
jgi:hypothetical protein